jgi:hypothetical protein
MIWVVPHFRRRQYLYLLSLVQPFKICWRLVWSFLPTSITPCRWKHVFAAISLYLSVSVCKYVLQHSWLLHAPVSVLDAYNKVAKCCLPSWMDPATAMFMNTPTNLQFDTLPPTRKLWQMAYYPQGCSRWHTTHRAVADGILPPPKEKSIQDVY